MLYQESILDVADNTGPKKVKCLKLINNHGNCKISRLGQQIIVAVQKKKVISKKKLLNKSVFYSLILTLKNKTRRYDGNFIKFSNNRVVLLNDEIQFLGTRVYGPITKEIRNTKLKAIYYKRIISYSHLTL